MLGLLYGLGVMARFEDKMKENFGKNRRRPSHRREEQYDDMDDDCIHITVEGASEMTIEQRPDGSSTTYISFR